MPTECCVRSPSTAGELNSTHPKHSKHICLKIPWHLLVTGDQLLKRFNTPFTLLPCSAMPAKGILSVYLKCCSLVARVQHRLCLNCFSSVAERGRHSEAISRHHCFYIAPGIKALNPRHTLRPNNHWKSTPQRVQKASTSCSVQHRCSSKAHTLHCWNHECEADTSEIINISFQKPLQIWKPKH